MRYVVWGGECEVRSVGWKVHEVVWGSVQCEVESIYEVRSVGWRV